MSRDPEFYPNPDNFDPERFKGLGEKSTLKGNRGGNRPAPDPRDWYFGYGRRICPGMHLAQASAFMAVACMLTAFEIRAKDPAMLANVTFTSETIVTYV